MPVYLLATLDTKGREVAYVRDRLSSCDVPTVLVDIGCLGDPAVAADVSRQQVFQAAGFSLQAARAQADRAQAVSQGAAGATALLTSLYRQGQVAGVLGIGGSAGTTMATTAMQALPLGIPKVMVSTLASGNVRGFVGDKDIVMINSVVDILGLNRISRVVLSQAAHAMAGMVKFAADAPDAPYTTDRPMIGATMFGVTTPCVERAREVLVQAGYEVLVFHATGTGGQAMESLVREGLIVGTLDLTTTEIADELVGGVFSAGPQRLTAAGEMRVPQVVSVGALDMVNFWAIDTVPAQFRDRQLYQHNANITLMRTTPAENERIGRELAAKLNRAGGPTVLVLPLKGVSAIDREGQPFDDPAARTRLLDTLRQECRQPIVELNCHINDAEFAERAAETLLELLRSTS